MRWVFASLLFINAAVLVAYWLLPEPQQAPVPVRSPQVEAGEGGLTLLSELDEVVKRKDGGPDSRLVGSSDQGRLCALLGPFPDARQGEYFVERLASMDIKGQLQQLEIPDEESYWVYLPPEVSKREALRRLHELQSRGVDSYVIPKGELANGISLGFFTDEGNAIARADEVIDLGYSAELKKITRTVQERWVVMSAAESEKLSLPLWAELKRDYDTIERRQNYCQAVASAAKFQ